MTRDVYAAPREVTDLAACHFYHTADIPGYGHVEGQWDLRAGIDDYLGNVDLRGKRVLEVGTASGFVCFAMEARGADVVACDLSEKDAWDVVPYAGMDYARTVAFCREGLRAQNNAYWLAHRAHRSRAKVVYGPVYALPDEVGPVHVVTFNSVLLHFRDPFLALAAGTRLATETVIVTDLRPPKPPLLRRLARAVFGRRVPAAGDPRLTFVPPPRVNCELTDHVGWNGWWVLTPDAVKRFLAVLGFGETKVTYHRQPYNDVPTDLYTIVGRRTCEAKAVGEFLKHVRASLSRAA